MPNESFESRLAGKLLSDLKGSIEFRRQEIQKHGPEKDIGKELQSLTEREVKLELLSNLSLEETSEELIKRRKQMVKLPSNSREERQHILLKTEVITLENTQRFRVFEDRAHGKSLEELLQSIRYRDNQLKNQNLSPREREVLKRERRYAEERHRELTRLSQKKLLRKLMKA